jgi:hypothetical protein
MISTVTLLHRGLVPERPLNDVTIDASDSHSDVEMLSASDNVSIRSDSPVPPLSAIIDPTRCKTEKSLQDLENRLDQVLERLKDVSKVVAEPNQLLESTSYVPRLSKTVRNALPSNNRVITTNVLGLGVLFAFCILCIVNKLPQATLTLAVSS